MTRVVVRRDHTPPQPDPNQSQSGTDAVTVGEVALVTASLVGADAATVGGSGSVSVSGATQADPTQLAVASGQTQDDTAYTALNVNSQAAGYRFADPVSSRPTTKITSSTFPAASPKFFVDYSEAGPFISHPWGGGNKYTMTVLGDFVGRYLVDYEYGVGLIAGSERAAAVGENDLTFCFSNVAATPQIAYGILSGSIQRMNTATNAVANTGNFPHALPGGTNEWLHQDKNDVVFTWFNGTTVYAWNSVTDVELSQSFAGLDEHHIELEGRYVLAQREATTAPAIWDVQLDSVSLLSPPAGKTFYTGSAGNFTFGHASAGRSRFTGIDWFSGGTNPTWYLDATTTDTYQLVTNMGGYPMANHRCGRWIQENVADLDFQWYLVGVFEPNGRIPNAVAFVRGVTGGSFEERFLCHHYSTWPPALAESYRSQGFHNTSPDGRLVGYNSNMLDVSTRTDVFVTEVPTA